METMSPVRISHSMALYCVVMVILIISVDVTSYANDQPTPERISNVVRKVNEPVDQTNAITITGDLTTLTPTNLAQTLVGNGMQISNVSSKCYTGAAGTFTNTGYTGIGLTSGVVLSTGLIKDVVGPNDSTGKGTALGTPGDTDLETILAAGTGSKTSFDACVLEFDFIPQSSTASFDYVFGSEEYNEYVDSAFNDVFGFFVNGVNCAVIDDSPVSINALNSGKDGISGGPNSDYFINNTNGTYNTQLDGLTQTLTCSTPVNPGVVNHVKLAIADAGDAILDSAVFIGAGSFVSSEYYGKISPTYNYKSVNNSSSKTYILALKNLGANTDSFVVSVNGNKWPTTFVDSGKSSTIVGPVDSLETYYIYANVAVPKDAVGTDAATITITSMGSGTVKPISSVAYINTVAAGANCKYVRELPKYYIPNIPMQVNINAIPSCLKLGNEWSLNETIPTGWTVSAISNNGVYSNGKISWTALPAKDTILTYMIAPANGASATATFSGSASVGKISFDVSGSTSIAANSAATHPADTNMDKSITLGEASLYNTYWKSGKSWSKGWNPIPAAFVSKSSEIEAKNFTYSFDSTSIYCPSCWVSAQGATDTSDLSTTVSRVLPSKYQPGEPITVAITINPPAATKAFVVEDTPPYGWAISDINNNGNFEGINRKVKWGAFKDNFSKTLSYKATPPLNVAGDKSFSLVTSFDGTDYLASTKISTDAQFATVESVSPDTMLSGTGPATLIIKGTGFISGATVSFSGTGIATGVVTVINSETISVPVTVASSAEAGLHDVVVNNPGNVTGTGIGLLTIIQSETFVNVTITSKSASKLVKYTGIKGTINFLASDNVSYEKLVSAISADSWITLDTANMKFVNGKGVLPYYVSSNIGADIRTGTIKIGSASFTVYQAGIPCQIKSAVFSSASMSAAGGPLILNVDVEPDSCQWRINSVKGADQWFSDQGNFPASAAEPITGDQTFSGIVSTTVKPRSLVLKLETIDGNSKKSITLKQSSAQK